MRREKIAGHILDGLFITTTTLTIIVVAISIMNFLGFVKIPKMALIYMLIGLGLYTIQRGFYFKRHGLDFLGRSKGGEEQ